MMKNLITTAKIQFASKAEPTIISCNTPQMQMALGAADSVTALINSKPRSPTKTEIYEAILGTLKTEAPAEDKPGWLRCLFADERGENDLLQFTGPSMAYYEIDGRRHDYEVVKWRSDSVERLRARVATWAKDVRRCNSFIVWRTRPEVTFDATTSKHKFWARLHLGHGLSVPNACPSGTDTPEV